MVGVLRWYQLQLARRPLLTQSVTTAFLFGAGDVLSQQAVENVGWANHNFARTGRMGLYGGIIFGPAATTWFSFLAHRVTLSSPATTVLARVVCDQLVFAPVMLGVFLGTMATWEGKSARERLQSSYRTVLVNNWKLWPAVQVLNFRFTPEPHRVLVVNLVALGWNCYLSFLNSQGARKSNKTIKHAEEEVKRKAKDLK